MTALAADPLGRTVILRALRREALALGSAAPPALAGAIEEVAAMSDMFGQKRPEEDELVAGACAGLEPALVTQAEAAEYLGLSTRSVRRRLDAGLLERAPGSSRITRSSLHAYARRANATGQ